jgi:hypothetical protein
MELFQIDRLRLTRGVVLSPFPKGVRRMWPIRADQSESPWIHPVVARGFVSN